jgi:hypothetical protein
MVLTDAVTVRCWNPAQAHALERRALSGQSQAHCGTLDSPRLPFTAVIVGSTAVVVVVVVLITVNVLTLIAVLVLVVDSSVVTVTVRSVTKESATPATVVNVETDDVTEVVTGEGVDKIETVTGDGVTVTVGKRAAQSEDLA